MIIKNSNLRKNLFDDRYKILAIVVAIILVLCLIRVLNGMAKNMLQQSNTKTNTTSNVISNYKPQETTVLGENVSSQKQEENTKIINEFIKFCNSKEIEKAYNLLTDECKEELFNSNIENFKNNYVEKIFDTYKTYNMQSLINARNVTYKIRIMQDALVTGTTGEVIEDYYTIVNKNGIYKINIDSYIGGNELKNSTSTKNNITITVISKNTYKDYETYKLKVENNTNNTILLDTKEKQKSAYATGNNGATYTIFMHEIDNMHLTIKPKMYSIVDVKVNKIYSPNIRIDKLSFTDVVLNLEEYNQTENKSEYKKETINVEL